jgi:diguanylate cyclase (GGDEF)-like protein
LQEQLKSAVERSLRSGVPVAMLMIDVDHFKKYNDQHGHPAGDEALRTVARLVQQDRRQVDVVARYGGEEFAIILYDATREQAADVAEKIRQRISVAPILHADKQPLGKMTVSVGVAVCPEDARTAESLLEAADVALYRAKKSGRDTVVVANRR